MKKEMELEKIVANLVRKVERRFYGKYRGFVKSNEDPEKLGRLLVTVPPVLGKKTAVWAFPCAPYGGMPNRGFFFIPEEKAGVWIEFEEGDPEFPIWVGTFWSKPGGKGEAPKPNKADGSEEGENQKTPTCKLIKTEKGHTIQLEDKKDGEMITIVEAVHKHVITLDKDGIKITDGANKHEILLDNSGMCLTDGANSGNKVTMDSSGAKVEDKNGNVVEMAGGGVIIKSNAVKIGSSGAAEPLVLGTQLDTALKTFVTQLKTHTHSNGNMGSPTGPPTPPPELVLTPALSTKHKTE